jgi:hypothetical protein
MDGVGILTNLASSLIAFVVGIFSRNLWTYWRKSRPIRRALGTWNDKDVTVVLSDGPRDYSRILPALFEGDVLAANYISSSLQRIFPGRRIHVRSASAFRAEHDLGGNLVIVGGPATNRYFAAMAERLELPIEFEVFRERSILIKKSDGSRRPQVVDDEGRTIKDYAVLILSSNPFDPTARVIMVAGCGTLGTTAAARMLAEPNMMRLARALRGDIPSCVVIESELIEGYVPPPKILEVIEL